MDDLQRLGGQIAEQLTLLPPGVAFRFDASSVPVLPRTATSDRIVLERSHHDYNGCWRADALHLHATRQTLRALGVVVLAALFSPPDSVTDITLTHPATDIRTLRLRPPTEMTGASLRRGAPLWCDYWPREAAKFPWADKHVDPNDLPALYLTDAAELGGVTDAQWLNRDTAVGFGGQEGTARFGQLLLDIGHPANTGTEFHLEGEAGSRGVAPLSAELIIWLPGSLGWKPGHGLE